MSNTVAYETLDAMRAVCGARCATWVGKDEHGDREYTFDCLDEDGQRYVVNHSDLLGAVVELEDLLGCDLSDV
ncbi:MAG: hypothetical protein V3T53_04745 [Phycisphaerales bacterium]